MTIRSTLLSLAAITPMFVMPTNVMGVPRVPVTASADTQSRTGDVTQKTGDKAVKRDKEAEKKQKDEAKRRADEDKKRGTAERRNRDGKSGDDHATQRGDRPAQIAKPRPLQVVDRTRVVFVGGYFYDPYFGEYPWWPPVVYPHLHGAFQGRAEVRLLVTPPQAAVYVDGFYAGVVDDFDGFFQRLPLLPGGHTIALYLEGFRTITRSIYLSPGSELRIRENLAPLLAGETSAPPTLVAMLPPPPTGSYIPPQTASRDLPPPPIASQQPSVQALGFGLLSLRYRPLDAVVTIDGQEWITSAPGELAVHLTAGLHVIDVKGSGSRVFEAQVEVLEGQTTELNIAARPTTW